MKLYFAILSLLFTASPVFAHGLVSTQRQADGQFIIEFEYNTLGNISAGDLTTYYTYLLDSNNNPVDFDGVYFNLSKNESAPSLVAILQESPDIPGSARVSALLKDPGDYVAEIHFNKDGKIAAQAKFNFTVGASGNAIPVTGSKQNLPVIFFSGIIGLILGMAIYKQFVKA